MSSITQLAQIVAGAVRQARSRDRIMVGQIYGASVIAGGTAYRARYVGDVDPSEDKPVYVVVNKDAEAVVLSER